MNKVEERKSNFELMRIVSMFLIVLGHVIIHSSIKSSVSPSVEFLLSLIEILCYVHVNSFVLVSGYFQYKSKFKLSKVLKQVGLIAFYNIFINLFLNLSGLYHYNFKELLESMFFLNYSPYWFFARYIILYSLSPYINKLIDSISKRDCKKLIFILVLFVSLLPYFTMNLFITNSGSNIVTFFLLYIIGAYMQKYNLIDNIFKKRNREQKILLFLGIYLGFSCLNFVLHYFGIYLQKMDIAFTTGLSSNITLNIINYSSPLILAASIGYFLLFGSLNIKNNFINIISKSVFGVYLIHENPYVRSLIITPSGTKLLSNSNIFLRILLLALCIFGWCLVIDLLRRLLLYFINKIKFISKLSEKINDYIHKLVYISE